MEFIVTDCNRLNLSEELISRGFTCEKNVEHLIGFFPEGKDFARFIKVIMDAGCLDSNGEPFHWHFKPDLGVIRDRLSYSRFLGQDDLIGELIENCEPNAEVVIYKKCDNYVVSIVGKRYLRNYYSDNDVIAILEYFEGFSLCGPLYHFNV